MPHLTFFTACLFHSIKVSPCDIYCSLDTRDGYSIIVNAKTYCYITKKEKF